MSNDEMQTLVAARIYSRVVAERFTAGDYTDVNSMMSFEVKSALEAAHIFMHEKALFEKKTQSTL